MLLACWDGASNIGFRGAPRIAPQHLRFGEYLGGASFSREAALPKTTGWATTTNDYLGRVRTTTDGRRLTSRPFVDYDPLEPLVDDDDPDSSAAPPRQGAQAPRFTPVADGCTIEATACDD